MTSQTEFSQDSKQLYRRLLTYIKPYKTKIIIAIVGIIAMAISQPILAVLVKLLLDKTLIARELEYVIIVPLLFLAASVFAGTSSYIVDLYTQVISQGAIATIRREMYAKLNILSVPLLDEKTSGHLISKISYDVEQVTQALSEAWIILMRDSLVVVGLISYLFYVSWQLSMVMLLVAPMVFFVMQAASKKMRMRSKKQQKNMGRLTQILQEGVKGYREVRLYNAHETESQRFEKVSEQIKKTSIRITQITALNVPIIQFLAMLSAVAMIYLAVFLNSSDSLSVGDFVSYIVALLLVFEPIRELTRVNPDIQKGLVASASIFELLDSPIELDEGKIQLKEKDVKGAIEFKNVNFSFKDINNPLFSNFNLTLKAGEMVAIIGESGSGKTTLTNLMVSFYRPQQGDILLDGVSIHKISLRSLRSQIALVSQHIVLFNDTVRANVAYGANAQASDEEIQQALDYADAWEFVQKLPAKMEEKIGDSGVKLSGGQKQRLSLARAFLKNAPILILDEASSALDSQTEKRVQNAINRLAKDRTTIVIAHRMSTIKQAPRILVMQQGEVIEEGDHDTLLTKQGVYAKLYQFGVK